MKGKTNHVYVGNTSDKGCYELGSVGGRGKKR